MARIPSGGGGRGAPTRQRETYRYYDPRTSPYTPTPRPAPAPSGWQPDPYQKYMRLWQQPMWPEWYNAPSGGGGGGGTEDGQGQEIVELNVDFQIGW